MATPTCLTILPDLSKSIDDANNAMIVNMTDPSTRYEDVCIKPNTTYEFFYDKLQHNWNTKINNFVTQPTKCNTFTSKLVELYNNATPENINTVQNVLAKLQTWNEPVKTQDQLNKLFGVDLNNMVFEIVSKSMKQGPDSKFELSHSVVTTAKRLAHIISKYCACHTVDFFKLFANKYRNKYSAKFQNKTSAETIQMLRDDYQSFKKYLAKFAKVPKPTELPRPGLPRTGIFSIESELDNLIPSELGSLKAFFIKVISKYYNSMHPIVWAQIYRSMGDNLFTDLPFTRDEIFAFGSKYTLLNSGPFILKILQMIRPVLSPELQRKYNLTKLTYPTLTPKQVDIILSRAVYHWPMYQILANISASVGHVCKVVHVHHPDKPFMIKIIKPIAVAQSCWEYNILHDIYPEGSCERTFIENMLKSNGRELNVQQEIRNLQKGHEYYTATYPEIFGNDINATLTTIENIPDIIYPDCWYAMTMTLAPGVPLSKIVEDAKLEREVATKDTIYRAKLHRCLDLLVYKFFHNLVNNGFYHGDLHAGNIFFSYEKSQMTLIDFGAVGEIDIYSDDPSTRVLLDTIVMAIFYNYDGMLDTMTKMLNQKCPEHQIDMDSPGYLKLKEELAEHRRGNILAQEEDEQRSKEYENFIFGEERIREEKAADSSTKGRELVQGEKLRIDSIYSYYDYKPPASDTIETIVQHRDLLPDLSEKIGESDSITFAGVLEKIIKYYATSGVNIAIKFNEFYELQKAYALLLGVLAKLGYNPYRIEIVTKRAIISMSNLTNIRHAGTVTHIIGEYNKQSELFNEAKKKIKSTKGGDPFYRKMLKYKQKVYQLQQLQQSYL